jgi:hypothetical protein
VDKGQRLLASVGIGFITWFIVGRSGDPLPALIVALVAGGVTWLLTTPRRR